MLYSKQKIYCAMCGKLEERPYGKFHDRVCSMRCHHEYEWRHTLSIMGKEYYPDPREYDADGYKIKAISDSGR